MIDKRENNHWTVYIHIIPKELSGYNWDKYYVGVTGTSVQERWHRGLGYKRNNRPGCYFYKAINKYGWNNIIHEIVAENLTMDEAKNMEILLIEKLKSFNPKYGYNRTRGGDGLIGHKHTNATKLKMSQSLKGKNAGKNNLSSIPIIQFSKAGQYLKSYESISQVTKNMIYPEIKDKSLVHRALTSNTHLAYNYIWMKLSDVEKVNDIYQLSAEDYKKYVKSKKLYI